MFCTKAKRPSKAYSAQRAGDRRSCVEDVVSEEGIVPSIHKKGRE
jgi:hypothetical protein